MNDGVEGSVERHKKLRLRIVLLVGVPLVAALIAGGTWLMGGRYVTTDNAYVAAQKAVITPSVAGRVANVFVTEGQTVKPGDPLFTIDPVSYELILIQAEARLAGAVSTFETLKGSLDSLIRQIGMARETLALRQADFDRKAELLQSKAASRNDVDAATLALTAARSALEMLLQQQTAALSQIQGHPDLSLADFAPYREALAARDKAKRDFDATTIRAPMAGIATQVPAVQPGRYLMPGASALVIVDAAHPWITANPKETDLTHLREGQKVKVEIDAYPGRVFAAHLASLSPGTGAEFALLPAQNASGNWVKVVQRVPIRIEFDDLLASKDLRAGMSATIEVDTGYSRLFGTMPAEGAKAP
ncbi:MAG: HlyD family secretion protein [Alphaproteobacteria bacterium]|nr:HlyD family secretion protein [Alphaproteobacteria bacterium]